MHIQYRIQGDRAVEAFRRAPEVMTRHVAAGTERGAHVVARNARARVSKAHSTLANSIDVAALDSLPPDWVGHEAAAGTHYAPYVEHGTGPAAGRPRYYPNPDNLMDHLLNVRGARRFAWARGGRRESQRLEVWFRARAWAWHIYQHGTRPHPYMRPAAEQSDSAVRRLIARGVESGIREVFHAD